MVGRRGVAGTWGPTVEALQPLGDQAALAAFAEEGAALRWAEAVRGLAAPWLVDVVQAYTRVAVYFDLGQTTFAAVAGALHSLPPAATAEGAPVGRLHRVPCCYGRQLDLERVDDLL